jgi:hypothetical protein
VTVLAARRMPAREVQTGLYRDAGGKWLIVRVDVDRQGLYAFVVREVPRPGRWKMPALDGDLIVTVYEKVTDTSVS